MSRAILITGAGARVGRHLAKGLAQDGWAVAIHYNRSKSGAETLTNEIRGKGGHCLLYTSPSPRDATLSRMPSSA